jgi:hypothetical protein
MVWLADHGCTRGYREFNPANGEVVGPWVRDVEPSHWGQLCLHRGQWFAFWKPESRLVLQRAADVWPAEDPYQATVTSGRVRTFRVLRGPVEVFRTRYFYPGLLAEIFDPTYDAVDEMFDDFFCYVASTWSMSMRDYDSFTVKPGAKSRS